MGMRNTGHIVAMGYAGLFAGALLAALALLTAGPGAALAPLGLVAGTVLVGALAAGWHRTARLAVDATSGSTLLEAALIGALALIVALSEPGRIAPMGALMAGLSVVALALLHVCRRHAGSTSGAFGGRSLSDCESWREGRARGERPAGRLDWRGARARDAHLVDWLDGRDDVAAATPEPVGISRLTAREAEVLAWLARGYSLRAIASELGVTAGTVDTHVRHIYQKLGVHKRDELLRLLGGRPAGR